MRRLIGRFQSARESFWFLPAVMSASAVLLSFITLTLDDTLDWRGLGSGPFGNAGSADGARTLLATIAGSMITVASLTFSITIASLSLASSQFGRDWCVTSCGTRATRSCSGRSLRRLSTAC